MSSPLTRVGALFVAPAVAPVEQDELPAASGERTSARLPAAPATVIWEPPVGGQEAPSSRMHAPSSPLESPVDAGDVDRRGRRWFLGPAPATVWPADVAVVGSGADAVVLGAALAGELRARLRTGTALLLVWDPSRAAAAAMPAWPAARALAEVLAAAVARGRLVEARLAPDTVAAASAAARITRQTRVPTVVVLAGPRPEAFDDLLATRDVVVALDAAGNADGVAGLAADELRRLNARVLTERPVGGLARRIAASSGLGRARGPGERLGSAFRGHCRAADGQASVLLVAAMLALVVGAVMLGSLAQGVGRLGAGQRAADLAALAGARALHAAQPRLFEPATIDGRVNPAHLERSGLLEKARAAAVEVGRRNGAGTVSVGFPDADSFAPVRIRVAARAPFAIGSGRLRRVLFLRADAEAEVVASVGDGLAALATGGGYDGPLAYRQGRPMRPDVALAFDRMHAAARADGIALLVNSGFRSDAEQAILFARRPDPRWVAPPGRSLHRNATELDLGPESAYGWLASNARRFGFVRRYSWEPWHYGYVLNPRSTPRGRGTPARGRGESAVPGFVPDAYVRVLALAAQRWNVSAALLAAQIYAESNFNPYARSPAGAQGIAQFMPDTARAYGLADPFDAAQSISAQARMMRDLLRQFGSVPLALAAYNAGPARVRACGCIPPFPETRAYVTRIVALMNGSGELVGGSDGGLVVRLVR